MATKKPLRSLTLRLPETQARELEKVAQVDGVPMTEAIRSAIEAHIEHRRSDPTFRERLTRILEEDREIFNRLAG